MFHYTDDDGYKAIVAQPEWLFKATKPPGGRPKGAYFTTLRPDAPRLAARLQIPKEKLQCVVCFAGDEGLVPYRGQRGKIIRYSPCDYRVTADRQVDHGPSEVVMERLA